MKTIVKSLCMLIMIAVFPVLAESAVNSSEELVIKQMKSDMSEIKYFLSVSKDYLKDPGKDELKQRLNTALDSIKKVVPTQINYYSSSLSLKDHFKECYVFSLYSDAERYSLYMNQYQQCHSHNCKENDGVEELINLLAEDIRVGIESCEIELSTIN